MDEDRLLSILAKTHLGSELAEVRHLYSSLTEAQTKFTDTFDIHCIDGCGHCCEHFVPDITPLEAKYLAFGIVAAEKEGEALDRLAKWDETNPACPLYDFDTPYHCSVYRWRPMICRLFGAAASTTKDGEPIFRHCKWNADGRSVTPDAMAKHPEDVVVMSDYATELEGSEVGETETELLPTALPKAIDEVRYLLEMCTGE